MKHELKIEVHGRVQGVNFRFMMKDFADKNGIKGYVMNKDSGDVLIILQGEKKKLESFLKWIQGNPGFVKIEGLSYSWRAPDIEYTEFTIKREQNYFIDKAKGVVNLAKRLIQKKEASAPVHIAIIPDGNRRWAKEKGLIGSLGHYKSAGPENIKSLIHEAKRQGVKYLSIWGFSTENWKRDKVEINAIFFLLIKNIADFKREADKNKIRFRHIGRKDRLPKKLIDALHNLEQETQNYREFNVQLCLDYGGRDEMVRAVNRILRSGEKKINEETLFKHLDTNTLPDPDLIIRTSGEKRTSGLMPFQAAYAELYFTDVHFPDFDARELRKAIEEYKNRQRRFGS